MPAFPMAEWSAALAGLSLVHLAVTLLPKARGIVPGPWDAPSGEIFHS